MNQTPQHGPEALTLPPMHWRCLRVTVQGLKPYVSNAMNESAVARIRERRQDLVRGGRRQPPLRTPEQQFWDSIHWTQEGRPGMPAAAFMGACLDMVSLVPFKPRLTRRRFAASMEIEGRLLPIEGPAPTMREDMIALKTWGYGPVYRAAFFPWSVRLAIAYDADQLQPLQIARLLIETGIRHGIGAGRRMSRRGHCHLGLGTFEVLPDMTTEPHGGFGGRDDG